MCLLNENQICKLASELDSRTDWKLLAKYMGFDDEEIIKIEKREESPTKYLIEIMEVRVMRNWQQKSFDDNRLLLRYRKQSKKRFLT